MIGRTISHYRVSERLGGGGMGVVYKAQDTRLRRTVALKFLPPELTRDEESKKRFVREARAASALDHPNICNIHDIDETEDGQLFICMSYYSGETLKRKLTHGPLAVDVAVNTVCQIATGLTKAHSEGIVHRDIKPANIMVTDDGNVKIVDFGLAKLSAQSKMTGTGSTLGTACYMSPEQVESTDVDSRSDIFSLGVVLYELLAGCSPFEADNEAAVIYGILRRDPPPIADYRSDVPRELQQVIDKALKKNVQERFQTVGEFRQDLERFMTGIRTVTAARVTRTRLKVALPLLALTVALLLLVLNPATRERMLSFLPFTPGTPKQLHLTVLPFENVGGNPRNQVFCDGIMETLTSKLTQLEQFHEAYWVVPASEVREYEVDSPGQAGRLFGANLAIAGSIQELDHLFRVTLNLVRVDLETPRQLRSSMIDVRMTDLVQLQSQTVELTAKMLDVELDTPAQEVLYAGGTQSSTAYDFYVRGRGYLQRYEKTGDIDLAIQSLEKAVEADNRYALAYAALAEAFWRKYEATSDVRWVDDAVENCARAAELGDALAPVHVTLGMIRTGTGDYDEALSSLQRALELDPTNASAYANLARAYSRLGRLEEAEAAHEKAIASKPDYWGVHNQVGRFYYRHGRHEDAARSFARVIDLAPNNIWGYNNLGAAYWYLENWEGARDMFRRSIDVEPNHMAYTNLGNIDYIEGHYATAARMFEKAVEMGSPSPTTWANLGNSYYWAPGERDKAREAFRNAAALSEELRQVNPKNASVLAGLASYYAMLGDAEKARERLNQALAIDSANVFTVYWAAHTHEQLGDRDEALHWLGKALDKGYPLGEIERDPFMAELRADERYRALLESPDD